MDMALQAKILRVIQEGEIERVGGVRTIAIDVRIVAASNKDIEKAVQEKLFRGTSSTAERFRDRDTTAQEPEGRHPYAGGVIS